MKEIQVSIIVSVKNEEKNLSHCLDCLKPFTDVIIVDSNSIDKTPEIAKKYDRKLINFNWNGKFPKKRNWVLENLDIKYDWVLFIDADEFLTDNFIQELTKKTINSSYNAYWISYNNFFMGSEQKHGLKMKKLALFKKNSGRYERIEESNWSDFDMEIHEHPIISGKIGKIKSTIIHKDFRGLSHYMLKHNQYSDWEVKRYLQLKNELKHDLTIRQKLKYLLLKTGLLPISYFMGTYFLKLGFLDGKKGLYFACYKAFYFFLIVTKLREHSLNNPK